MHKIYEFACKELKEIEDKIDKGLNQTELDYANKLVELKKNILKTELLEDGKYSTGGSYAYPMVNSPQMSYNSMGNRGNSYMNSGRYYGGRYSGDYSRMAANDIIYQLEDMRSTAPDEMSRNEISRLINRMRDI